MRHTEFHEFGQAKFSYGGLVLDLNKFSLPPKLSIFFTVPAAYKKKVQMKSGLK